MDEVTAKGNPRELRLLPHAETPIARRIAETVAHCIEHTDIGLIMSDPGAGKTVALMQLAASRPDTFYLCANNTERRSPAVLAKLCDAMGVWCRAERSNLMKAAIERTMEQRGRGALIVYDEAQHLDDSALETLRDLHDQNGIPIIFAANYDMPGRLTKSLPQLESRIGFVVRLVPTREDMEAIAVAAGVADKQAIDLLWGLCLAQRVKLKDGGKGKVPVWRNPSLRIPCKVLRKAVALTGNGAAVTAEHLERAMISLNGGAA